MLREFETRRTLTLRERQQVAGRMQRAVMTMPPGADVSGHTYIAKIAHRPPRRRRVRVQYREKRDIHKHIQCDQSTPCVRTSQYSKPKRKGRRLGACFECLHQRARARLQARPLALALLF